MFTWFPIDHDVGCLETIVRYKLLYSVVRDLVEQDGGKLENGR